MCVSMILIYQNVKSQEKGPRAPYNLGSRRRRKSEQVAAQGAFYILAYFFTWIFFMVNGSIQQQRTGYVYICILVLQTKFVPLMECFNAMVYIRPRYIGFRRQCPHLSFWQVLASVFWGGAESRELTIPPVRERPTITSGMPRLPNTEILPEVCMVAEPTLFPPDIVDDSGKPSSIVLAANTESSTEASAEWNRIKRRNHDPYR